MRGMSWVAISRLATCEPFGTALPAATQFLADLLWLPVVVATLCAVPVTIAVVAPGRLLVRRVLILLTFVAASVSMVVLYTVLQLPFIPVV